MANAQPPKKILRVGVIQNGRIIEEKLQREREKISVGQSLKNTLVIASPEYPKTFTLFDVKGGNYVLNFTDEMRGRITVGDGIVDLNTLKQSGRAKKSGGTWSVELTDRARGKIGLGDVTLLFQFVNPPPLKVLPQLPANMRGGFLQFVGSVMGLTGAFLGSLIGSGVIQIGIVVYLVTQVPPPPRAVEIEEMPDRLLSIVVPEAPEEPPEPVELEESETSEDGEGPAEDEPDPEPTPDPEPRDEPAPEQEEQAAAEPEPEPTRTREEIRQEARQQVMQQSALAALTAGGDEGANLNIGTTTSLTDRTAEETLQRQASLGEGAGGDGIVSNRNLGTSEGAEGSVDRRRVDTGGGSAVAEAATAQGAGERERVRARPEVRGGREQTAGSGSLDASNLRNVLRRKERDIRRCYERGLAQNPSLSGRLVIQFRVGRGGRVDEVSLRTNELGSAVGRCIEGAVRRWRFDEPEGGFVVVRRPYILEPGQ